MMPVMLRPLVALLLGLTQDPAPKPGAEAVDRVFFQDRSELHGEIVDCTAAGRFKLRLAGVERPLEFGFEEVARLRFSSDESRPGAPSGEQVRVTGGGTLAGKVRSFDGEVAVVESAVGLLQLRR